MCDPSMLGRGPTFFRSSQKQRKLNGEKKGSTFLKLDALS